MEVNLSKEEIGVLIKCVDTAIMFYISHQWDTYSEETKEKRRLEGISLNELKEKFCKTLMKEEEDNIKTGGAIQIEKKGGRQLNE